MILGQYIKKFSLVKNKALSPSNQIQGLKCVIREQNHFIALTTFELFDIKYDHEKSNEGGASDNFPCIDKKQVISFTTFWR